MAEAVIIEAAREEGKKAEAVLKKAVDLMERGEHWQAIKEGLDVRHAGDDHLKLLEVVVCFSSGLKEKAHFWTVGRSQMGKSHLEDMIPEFFPNVLVYDSQSALFLIYQTKKAGPEYLKGKIVILEEVQDNPAVWSLIKKLTSADKEKVTHGTVIRGRPVELKIDGLPVVLSNSVETSVDEQVNNRFIIGNVDEGEAQDRRVRELQDREAQGIGLEEGREKVVLARTIITQILTEKDVEVIIPSADLIEIPMVHPRVNRKKFMRLVKAVTYGNLYTRVKVGDLYIATEEDVKFAYRLWLEVQTYQHAQLDETGVRILREIPFDTYEPLETILEKVKVNPSTARKRLKKLYEQNLVDERRTKEVEYDERGYQKIIPGWSLEYKRMVGDLDWYNRLEGGISKGNTNPFPRSFSDISSPLKGDREERARHYEKWMETLHDEGGGFPIATISTKHNIEGDEKTSLIEYILGEET